MMVPCNVPIVHGRNICSPSPDTTFITARLPILGPPECSKRPMIAQRKSAYSLPRENPRYQTPPVAGVDPPEKLPSSTFILQLPTPPPTVRPDAPYHPVLMVVVVAMVM